jgi:hypothetical protein
LRQLEFENLNRRVATILRIFFVTRVTALVISFVSGMTAAEPDGDAALAKEQAGDVRGAYADFLKLANNGNAKAMLDVGRLHYEGKGVPRDYALAMEWWVKAFEQGEGMAYNNIAVLYRDGLGVDKNLKIAWGLLFIGHTRGLGGEDTVMRINQNLRKVMEVVPKEDVHEACRWSEEYFKTFVRNRGRNPEKYEALKLSRNYPPVLMLATM